MVGTASDVDGHDGGGNAGNDGAHDIATLAEPARARVVQIASDLLGRLKQDEIPASLRAIAKFTPNRRRQRGGVAIAAALDNDDRFRGRVAELVEQTLPELVDALHSGVPPAVSDPSDVAAAAYLVRPDGWQAVIEDAHARWAAEHKPDDRAELAQLRRELAELRARIRTEPARIRDAVSRANAESDAELARLKRALRARAGQVHAAERDRDEANAALAELERKAEAAAAGRDAELRRLRARLGELERAGESARRDAKAGRDIDEARLWLLVETLTDAAAGVRRELSLAPPSARPADAVTDGCGRGRTRRSADHPLALDRLLALPRAHLIIDGYNVTKTGYGELALSAQRERLISGLATLAGRSGAEITVAFDGGPRPPAQPRIPRGVRVLFSAQDQIADDLIRQLVDAEPAGRPVIVVTSDQAVVDDVRRAGAWTAPSAVLVARLG